MLLSFLRRHFLQVSIVLFILCRLFIWLNPPPSFSEIIYSYMPYAHLWASGVQPYREQWYEYPPATIPLFFLPHVIDSVTHGNQEAANWYHLNYSQVYRGQLFIVDILLFSVILVANYKYVRKEKLQWLNILGYLLVTTKAQHFIYDTMDLTFAATITVSAVAPLIWSNLWQKELGKWFGFWLATALKLVNLPLALAQAFWVWPLKLRSILFAGAAATLIWGIPLFLYRSSLQVILVYHQQRGVQVDSVPGLILRVVGRITKSEKIIEVYKNYEIAGPITTQWLPAITALQFFSFAAFGLWAGWKMWRLDNQQVKDVFLLASTFGFFLLFMLVGKVQSTPFLLWLLPLAACYAWPTWQRQLSVWIAVTGIIFVTMTKVPNTELGILTLPILVGLIRSGLLLYVFWSWATQLPKVLSAAADTPSTKVSAKRR